MNIYAALSAQEQEVALLRRIVGHDSLWLADPARPDANHAAFLEADVVFGSFPADLLERARRLRWIQFVSVGIEGHLATDWSRLPGLVCTNLRGVYAEPMAETALAGILALKRGIDQLAGLQARRTWAKARLHGTIDLLHRARVLLLGAGSVNSRLRELLEPFGCEFRVFSRTTGDLRSVAELDGALPWADVVCAALPDTPQTRGLLDARRIGLFQPGALLVNVGRGSLVEESALVAALQSGRLGGAVLDVTQSEPLAPDDPLWTCPRTLLTQHTSAGSRQLMADAVTFFGRNLDRFRRGEPLLNVIDWKRGY